MSATTEYVAWYGKGRAQNWRTPRSLFDPTRRAAMLCGAKPLRPRLWSGWLVRGRWGRLNHNDEVR